MWRISGVIDSVLVNALVEMVPEMAIRLLSRTTVETVALLSKLSEATNHIDIKVDMDEMDVTGAEKKATYQQIKDYVLDKFGLKVSSLNIAQIKDKCGIKERKIIQQRVKVVQKENALLKKKRQLWRLLGTLLWYKQFCNNNSG